MPQAHEDSRRNKSNLPQAQKSHEKVTCYPVTERTLPQAHENSRRNKSNLPQAQNGYKEVIWQPITGRVFAGKY